MTIVASSSMRLGNASYQLAALQDYRFPHGIWSLLFFTVIMPDLRLFGDIMRRLPHPWGLLQLCFVLLHCYPSVLETGENRKWNQNRIPQYSVDDGRGFRVDWIRSDCWKLRFIGVRRRQSDRVDFWHRGPDRF